MKTRIDLSCTEEHLFDCICEVKRMMESLKIESISIKCYQDRNRDEDAGWAWVPVNSSSAAIDILIIYNLTKENRNLKDRIGSSPLPPLST